MDPWVKEDPLEREMAIHSSILAWKILWTEEPGGLQPMGSQSQTQLGNWAHTYTSKRSRYVDIKYFLKSNGTIINMLKKMSPLNHSQLKMVN